MTVSHFGSEGTKELLSARLVAFSRVAESSVALAQELANQGLGLLKAKFGGLGDVSPAIASDQLRFETELLREIYGQWTISEGGVSETIGYRSHLLDSLLGGSGITREHLEDFSRPPAVDRAIDANSWASRYKRDVVAWQQSPEFRRSVVEEMDAEFKAFNLKPFDRKRRLDRHIEQAFADFFNESGFVRKPEGYDNFPRVYTNKGRVDGSVALDLSVDVSCGPSAGLPLRVDIRFAPVFSTIETSAVFATRFQRGDFMVPLAPLIPSFGRYRTAWDFDQVSLLLHAHALLLNLTLPLLEERCADEL